MTPISAQPCERLPQPHDDLPEWPACLHWAPDSRHYWATRLGQETRCCVAVLPLPAWSLPGTPTPHQSPTEVVVARPGLRGWNWDELEWRSAFATSADAVAVASGIIDNLAAWWMERVL